MPDAGAERWKILLIDDNEVALEFEASVLSAAGFDVQVAASVETIDAVLDDWSPDVIITEVEMPQISGVELCRALKNRYATAHVPVVLTSALSADELAPLARQCEADGYLSKIEGIERFPEEVRALCVSLRW